jgi:hypothetical protein
MSVADPTSNTTGAVTAEGGTSSPAFQTVGALDGWEQSWRMSFGD